MARLGSRQFQADVGALIGNVEVLDVRTQAMIGALMERSGDQAVAYMKVNAPWTDRTGNARSSLGSTVFRQGSRWVLNLFGLASYQIYLEKSNGSKYAIIGPTILLWGPRTMAQFVGLFDRLRARGPR